VSGVRKWGRPDRAKSAFSVAQGLKIFFIFLGEAPYLRLVFGACFDGEFRRLFSVDF
jgi:hypothetical protein